MDMKILIFVTELNVKQPNMIDLILNIKICYVLKTK